MTPEQIVLYHHKELLEYLQTEFFKGRDEGEEIKLDDEEYKLFIMDDSDEEGPSAY